MKQLFLKHKQLISYIFWAVMTTAVSWLSYSVYIYLLGLIPSLSTTTAVFIANTLSWITAVAFSFVANKIRVFESKSWKVRVVFPELIKFFSTRAATGLLEIVLVPVFVALGLDQTFLGVDGLFSKVIVTPTVILLNYLFGKFFVFKKRQDKTP